MSDERPKSAIELAMERLKRKDLEAGIEERALTDDQRKEIADVRRVFEARLAEMEILHGPARAKATTPEELEALEEGYRRERDRAIRERDERIEKIKRG
jgi:hypothetical protein